MNKVLIVAAHCDDELLGAGCFIEKLIKDGKEVSICCMTCYAPTREEDIHKKMKDIHKRIGVKNTFIAPFVALSSIGDMHIDKVKFVENAIIESECDTVITHSKCDLHKDHVETHDIVMEAVRCYQRFPDKYSKNRIKKVLEMEIPCASLWGQNRFNPNFFVDIDLDSIQRKIEYVSEYDYVIREAPHPRSLDVIKALATVRGSQCGTSYAEAFRLVFCLED